MTIKEITEVLQARTHCAGPGPETCIQCACGADLMSDVMAFTRDKAVLLTGLVTPATVRTAELLDIPQIVFVRGKNPARELVDQANEAGICLCSTDYSLFEACGRLYTAGMASSNIQRTAGTTTVTAGKVPIQP